MDLENLEKLKSGFGDIVLLIGQHEFLCEYYPLVQRNHLLALRKQKLRL
jgi:hypothetical protein